MGAKGYIDLIQPFIFDTKVYYYQRHVFLKFQLYIMSHKFTGILG